MTDDTRGTLHTLLHVRPPADIRIPGFKPSHRNGDQQAWWTPELYPRLRHSRAESIGANLRFKTPDLAANDRAARRPQWGTRP